jgi:hypothetical protein
MALVVKMGSMLQCSFGMAPSSLIVTPEKKVLKETPVANIMDNVPFKNILPFAMCTSLANPTVAAATAAAFGVLTPMPCIPVIPAPWMPGNPKVLVGNMPVVTQSCKLMCTWGGCISVVMPGQVNVQA